MEPTVGGHTQVLPDHLHAPFLHAGFWLRFAALLIDSLILTAAAFVVAVVLAIAIIAPAAEIGGDHAGNAASALFGLVFWLVLLCARWLYFALFESSKWQATPGKLALGLRVTDLRGGSIGFGRATGRYFGKFISGLILSIGYMLAGWTARKQALHDMMAGCCVVRRDGLAALEREQSPASIGVEASVAGPGMPRWAIALIVLGGCLFAVVPVVAIVAAIAIPAYQDYTIRAQVAEGVSLADGAKAAVEQYMVEYNSLPADSHTVGLDAADSVSGSYVTDVQVEQGNVWVFYGNHAGRLITGHHIVFTPQIEAGVIRWRCWSPDIQGRYLPASCSNGPR